VSSAQEAGGADELRPGGGRRGELHPRRGPPPTSPGGEEKKMV
jgi:hypothetical protein